MIPDPSRRAWTAGLGLVALIVSACRPPTAEPENALRVATTWPEAKRRRLEQAFQRWSIARPSGPTFAIAWVEDGGDVRLGGPIDDHPPDALAVGVARIGLFGGEPDQRPTTWDGLAESANAGRLAIGDPRRDPIARELAVRWMAADGLAVAWNRLVPLYARSALVATGSPRALVDRGRADWALTVDSDSPLSPVAAFVEGASIEPSTHHAELAETFLTFLRESVTTTTTTTLPDAPAGRDLLVDLLGSVLVDARGSTGLPPWPPASIRALRDRDDGGSLVQLLAEQLVPDAEARAWLLQSWDEAGLVDERRLASLAGAVDGRLAREPRFRAWLRGEWTAWARGSAVDPLPTAMGSTP